MKSSELLALLREFYRDKLSMRQRHFNGAQSVSDYDFNNTYQYVIAREDVQLNWVRDAIIGMGGTAGTDVRESRGHSPADEARRTRSRRRARSSRSRRRPRASWRSGAPRVESMPNARHKACFASSSAKPSSTSASSSRRSRGARICSAAAPTAPAQAGECSEIAGWSSRTPGPGGPGEFIARERVAIALGSNLGDRRAAIAFAAERLAPFVSNLQLSDLIETEPEGEGPQDQPLYLNGVVVGETSLGAREMLDAIMAVEQAYGRERPFPGAARTLDIDLFCSAMTSSSSRASRFRTRGSAIDSSCSVRLRRSRPIWWIRSPDCGWGSCCEIC